MQNSDVYRILDEKERLVINTTKMTMPEKMGEEAFKELCTTPLALWTAPAEKIRSTDNLSPTELKIMRERFTVISPILSFLGDLSMRNYLINSISEQYKISKQTIRKYLCQYLSTGRVESLAPKEKQEERPLNSDELNFRWALNKFFYTQRKNSLQTAYKLMLKEKYTDYSGVLLEKYPAYGRFYYYYRKHRKPESERISRNGLTEYQRNARPILSTINDLAYAVGFGMVDSTICDIHLVDESGKLAGRPILTICVDAYSRLICGFSLGYDGGMASVSDMMLNVVEDKVAFCSLFNLTTTPSQWPCNTLPAVIIADNGREYDSTMFGQITELGIKITNLPPYRPELKGAVEKAFDIIQNLYKSKLKGKGVIEPDFQERGAHDYRLDACLTLAEFKKIVVCCIIHYNSKNALVNLNYTKDMIDKSVEPYPCSLYNYSLAHLNSNTIPVSKELLYKTMLPRTVGKFTRKGLIANGQRYRHTDGNFTKRYLNGGDAQVAFEPCDASRVWLVEKGVFTEFELVLKNYDGMSFDEIDKLKSEQKEVIKGKVRDSVQAEIDLQKQIDLIVENRSFVQKKGKKNA